VSLEQLLNGRHDLWRGREAPADVPAGLPTGFPDLDALLPWRGWPPGCVTELLDERPGGPFELLLPTMVDAAERGRWLLLVSPPFVPYAPTLVARGLDLTHMALVVPGEEVAWAAEQGLRSGACAAVLVWGGRWNDRTLRRLQLASAAGDSAAFLFRDGAAARGHSAAALRLGVRTVPGGLELTLLKLRGGRAGRRLMLPMAGSTVDPAAPVEMFGRMASREASRGAKKTGIFHEQVV